MRQQGVDRLDSISISNRARHVPPPPPISLFILLCQSAFLALGQIWANKVRAILTTIGIVIGVASVTAVIAALTGLKANVLTEFESFGTNKIFIFPDRPDGRHGATSLARDPRSSPS